MRYYLDAAPVIYSVEEVPPYAAAVDARLSAPDVVRVASDLTRMECRVRPIRDHNDDLLKDFDEYFDETVDEIVGLSRMSLIVQQGSGPSMGSKLQMLSTSPLRLPRDVKSS